MNRHLLVYIMLLSLFTVHKALAARWIYGNTITINEPVFEDVYIAGGTVTISAPVYGDLVVAGGTVVLEDTVMNDVNIAGGRITLNGFVGDDVRCAGGELVVLKNVMGDLILSGGNVTVAKTATINGGLIVSGGKIRLEGAVRNKVKVAAGEFVFTGIATSALDCKAGRLTIDGNVMGRSTLAANKIIIGDNAAFHDQIRYWNKKGALNFKSSLKNGNAIYDPSLKTATGRWYYLGFVSVLSLLWYLGMALLLIVFIQYFFGGIMQRAGDTIFDTTFKALVFGLLFFVAVPVAAIITFITIIGIPLGVLLLLGYVVLVLLSTVITSVVAANWVNGRFNYGWKFRSLVFAALGMFILLKLLSLTPFLGWLMTFIVICMAYGGILLNVKWKKHSLAST